MSTEGNLFGDLLRIGGGDVTAVSERLHQLQSYANTVSSVSSDPASPPPSTRGTAASAAGGSAQPVEVAAG